MATTEQNLQVDRFMQLIQTGTDPDQVLADDVFVDVNVPQWRFQLQGRDAVCDWVSGQIGEGTSATVELVVPTAEGFVVDSHCEIRTAPGAVYCRALYVARTTDGRITELIVYCTGPWDAETRERQAREAPMLRA